jgi:mRNA interferase MazF
MAITQGGIYWVPSLEDQAGSESGYTHPYVVIHANGLDRSSSTVVVCRLTSNIKQAKAPGNVLLEAGEANLPRPSVVVVSQISTLDQNQLGEYIGSLTSQRMEQILAGIRFLQLMTERP